VTSAPAAMIRPRRCPRKPAVMAVGIPGAACAVLRPAAVLPQRFRAIMNARGIGLDAGEHPQSRTTNPTPPLIEVRLVKLTVNGEAHEHEGDGRLAALLAQVGSAPSRTAVMINGDVIPRSRWDFVRLAENDQIELLVFAGGG